MQRSTKAVWCPSLQAQALPESWAVKSQPLPYPNQICPVLLALNTRAASANLAEHMSSSSTNRTLWAALPGAVHSWSNTELYTFPVWPEWWLCCLCPHPSPSVLHSLNFCSKCSSFTGITRDLWIRIWFFCEGHSEMGVLFSQEWKSQSTFFFFFFNLTNELSRQKLHDLSHPISDFLQVESN